MNLQKSDAAEFILSLTARELELILSCLRESFAALDRKEYELRVGISIDEALKVTMELKRLMESEGLGG